MRIGVIFHGNLLAGGCFQQSLNAIRLLSKEESPHEFLYYTPDKQNMLAAAEAGIKARSFRFGRKQRLVHKIRKHITLNRLLGGFPFFQPFDAIFERDEVDLLYFTGPSPLCLFLERLNYVYTFWDLCHRDYPEFPEVRESFEFEAREDLVRKALPKAVAVIAESPLGKENLERRYGLDQDRVHWISISPAQRPFEQEDSSFDPRKAAKIPPDARYVFYPAQFWAHKNHRLIVDAIAYLREKNSQEFYAIFCGSNCGNLPTVLEMAKQKGVDDLVKYVGFVPDEQMSAFYKHSLALVMPSYFGPTNMPPLEAFGLDTPVIVSDLPGIRDQVGEAAMLIPPDKPDELAKAIALLAKDEKIRKSLVAKGRKRLSGFSDKDRLSTLRDIINSYDRKRLCWSIE
jgi:glycosyltransferase involved in cell wall biosynthesis